MTAMPAAHRSEDTLRAEIVEICRRLHGAGLVAGCDGNVSARLGAKALLTTPSGVPKGLLRPEDLVKTDLTGKPLGIARRKPSSELRLHLLAYRLRPEIGAAVHAHPAHAVALSLAGVSLAGCLLPETVLSLGCIPTAPYATPTTEEVPESVRHLLGRANAVILARHGTLTLGIDLQQAWLRLESLEHAARITALARAIGPVEPLGAAEQARLESLARELGITNLPSTCCTRCGTCGSPAAQPGPEESALASRIAARVVQRLGEGP